MRRVWLTLLLASGGLAPAPTRADDAPVAPPQGPYVVVVGVGEFADKAIQPRPTAEADARLIFDLFNSPDTFKAKPGRVKLLTATPDAQRGSEPATRENIAKALDEAVAKTGKDDLIVLAWFGRGSSAGDKTALFAQDTDFSERAKTSFLGSDLNADLKTHRDRKLCVMLDVSFKGFDAGKESVPDPNLTDVINVVFGNDDKGEAPLPTDRVIFLATLTGQDPLTAADGKHGLFASIVAGALGGKADKEGYEPDGVVTVDELTKVLETEGADLARQLGKETKDKEAVPVIIGGSTSHFVLTRNPAAAPKADARLAKLAEITNAQKLSTDVVTEGERLLERMPKLKAMQELRKKYQALADGELTAAAFLKEREALKASLKISAEDARTYAKKVLKAAREYKFYYVKELTLGQLVSGGITGLFRRADVPLPIELGSDLADAKLLSGPRLAELLIQARERLGKREDLDDGKDVDTTVLMMAVGLNDPYTTYYDKALLKKTESQLQGNFSGIGIQIRRDSVQDGLLVVSPIKGSPAYKAGLLAGDLITEIKRDVSPTGEALGPDEPKVVSTKGMKIEKALDLILGEPTVPVTVVVQRKGEAEPKEFTIKRGRVSVETVLGVERDAKDDWKYWLDPESKIAYIHLSQFTPTSAEEMEAALQTLRKQGMRGLVLDLRFNPGGLLKASALICNLFVDEGLVVSVRSRFAPEEQWFSAGGSVKRVQQGTTPTAYPAREGKAYDGFPMAVLVNDNSASASEIVSACLQDYGRAVVVGERSYGKGSVQQILDFEETAGKIKLTIARYFPPLGRNIDKQSTESRGKDEKEEWGVKPDANFEVKLSRDEKQDLVENFRDREIIKRRDMPADPKEAEKAKAFQDRQLTRAVDYLREQLRGGGKKANAARND